MPDLRISYRSTRAADDLAFAVDMLVQDDAVVRASQRPGQPMLTMFDRHPSQILAVDFE
jgi:hypothetical protein